MCGNSTVWDPDLHMQGSVFQAYAFVNTVLNLASCGPSNVGFRFWRMFRKAKQELAGWSCLRALRSGKHRGNATARASNMVLAAHSNGRMLQA